MKNVMTPLTLVLLTACFEPASQDEPRSTVTDPVSTEASIPADPGTSEEPELVIGELQAQGVQASSDERMEDALHLTNAMMEVLLWDEVNDYAEDHELDGNGALAPTMDSCVTVTLHIGYLDIDFDQCGQLDGTVILQTGLFTTVTTVIFEDDFSFRDIDIDGEFTAEYNLFTHGFELRDAEITLDDEVTFAAELEVGVFGTPSLWGTFDVTKGGTTITVVTGTETSPLTWGRGLCLPRDGLRGDQRGDHGGHGDCGPRYARQSQRWNQRLPVAGGADPLARKPRCFARGGLRGLRRQRGHGVGS